MAESHKRWTRKQAITLRSANPLFEYWILKWREETSAKGSNAQFTYNQALNSLRKYPVLLRNGRECEMLAYFGKTLCTQLDRKLEEFKAETSDSNGLLNVAAVTRYLQSLDPDVIVAKKSSKPGAVRREVESEEVSKQRVTTVRSTAEHSGQTDSGKYVPQYRSGSYALLVALHEFYTDARAAGRRWLSKDELIERAQPHCDASFTAAQRNEYYTAWSSMGKLISRHLVEKHSHPPRFSLTDAGVLLAEKLLQLKESVVNGAVSSDGNSNDRNQNCVETKGKGRARRDPKSHSSAAKKRPHTTVCSNQDVERKSDLHSDSDSIRLTSDSESAHGFRSETESRQRNAPNDLPGKRSKQNDSDSDCGRDAVASEGRQNNWLESERKWSDDEVEQHYDPLEFGLDACQWDLPADLDPERIEECGSVLATEKFTDEFVTQLKCPFTFVNAEGQDTDSKDDAACRVFEVQSDAASSSRAAAKCVGAAFQVRCSLSDLNKSGCFYEIEKSDGHLVTAFVADVATPNRATGLRCDVNVNASPIVIPKFGSKSSSKPTIADDEVLTVSDDDSDSLPPPISSLLNNQPIAKSVDSTKPKSGLIAIPSECKAWMDAVSLSEDELLPDLAPSTAFLSTCQSKDSAGSEKDDQVPRSRRKLGKKTESKSSNFRDPIPLPDAIAASSSSKKSPKRSRVTAKSYLRKRDAGAADVPTSSLFATLDCDDELSTLPSLETLPTIRSIPATDEADLNQPGETERLAVSEPQVSIATLPDYSFVLKRDSYEIVLCVDQREHFGGGASRQQLLNELVKQTQEARVQFELRKLEVGDFVWIARPKKQANGTAEAKEVVLDWLVERKRMDDLASSILDGRFNEQKFRMMHTGLRPVYLVEAYCPAGATLSHARLPLAIESVRQAVSNTRLIDGFSVVETKDLADTVQYLVKVTNVLQQQHNATELRVVDERVLSTFSVRLLDAVSPPQVRYRRAFAEFQRNAVKNRPLTVRSMLARWLLAVRGVGVARARAIAQHLGTPAHLYARYDALEPRARALLLASLQYPADSDSLASGSNASASRMRNVGPAVSKAVLLAFFDEQFQESKAKASAKAKTGAKTKAKRLGNAAETPGADADADSDLGSD